MRTLIAIDGSTQSMDAAHALTHLTPAEQVIVLHVVEPPVAPTYPWFPAVAHELYRNVERDLWEEAEHLLKQVVPVLPEGIGPVTARRERGKPADVIIGTAQREGTDLIVMGARGLTPGKEILFGSVSHRVVSHAPCSVLIVNRPMPSLRKALVAIESQQDAETVLRFFEKRVFHRPLEMEVLTVLDLPNQTGASVAPDDAMELALRSARRFAEDIAARLSTVQCCAVPTARVGAVADTILQRGDELGPDLIVVGSHMRSDLSRWLLGSVSHKVLQRSTCPVLIVR